MATAPTTLDPKTLTTRFEAPSRGFADKATMLQKLPLTQENAEQALHWDTQAKQWLADVEKECAPVRRKLFEAHRDFVALIRRQTDPVEKFRRLCATFRANYERQRLANIAEQRRIDEQRQLEEQQRQQQAEIEHLLAIAAETNDPTALEAAIEVESAPLAPVVSSVDPNAGKVDGSSVTLRKTGIITDARNFFTANTWETIADLIELKTDPDETGPVVKINQSSLDDRLNRGITLLGVEVFEKAITRNTSKG